LLYIVLLVGKPVKWDHPTSFQLLRLSCCSLEGIYPSDATESFHDYIIKFNKGGKYVIKFVLSMKVDVVQEALGELRRMNISRENLFPGLDGFARSTRYHLLYYKNQSLQR